MKVKFDVMVGKKWRDRQNRDFGFILLPTIGFCTEKSWCPEGRIICVELAWLFFDFTWEFTLCNE